MTTSNWTSRSIFFAALLMVCVLPSIALAAVKIVDVMYDPPGADTGREWIELANTGTTTVNLFGYRLYEGGVNHKLSVSAGTSTVDAGARAIIATDPGQYVADHPAFTGTLFKSSFSLSNTGETIELKDPLLAVVDTYSYTAPPVVKVQLLVTQTKSSSSNTTNKKGGALLYSGGEQAAALPLASVPVMPVPRLWLYVLGFIAILIIGAGAALYMWPEANTATLSTGEEFEIE